jgi:hypothetical protein
MARGKLYNVVLLLFFVYRLLFFALLLGGLGQSSSVSILAPPAATSGQGIKAVVSTGEGDQISRMPIGVPETEAFAQPIALAICGMASFDAFP